jgi:hypothetical protein
MDLYCLKIYQIVYIIYICKKEVRMIGENILVVCGIYNILLALFHIYFWKVFKWNETLEIGTKANKYLVQIMNIQLIYVFIFMAFIYIFFKDELLDSTLGYWIMFGYAGFWVVRFIQQFIFLKIKGKFVIGLTLLFFIGSVLHLIPILL